MPVISFLGGKCYQVSYEETIQASMSWCDKKLNLIQHSQREKKYSPENPRLDTLKFS